jgi:peptidoglycan/xylan/chitin deacetylase (PgdA/CDA1 family)
MKREGHRIGSHTYDHINHPTFSEAKVRENIMKPNPLLKDYLSPVLRLPYGGGAFRSSNAATQAKNDMVMRNVRNAGFKHVLWDIDTNDWDAKKRPTLLPTMLKDICRQKGGVVLFHDVQKFTADNLRSWIQAVKREGHTFAPLERFVPEAKDPLPAKACEWPPSPKALKALTDDVEEVINQIEE